MATLEQIFGANIRQYRKVRGLTQAQLAEAVGISVEMTGKLERGQAKPSFDTVSSLVDVLDVPPAVLFGAQLDGLPKGRRADTLNQINELLAEMNDAELEKAESVLQALAN